MKKIESLNNAQKTVLQLEKEINAIGNNLSKVKHKDHNTMKKIINNINYLLSKDEYKNKNYKNETNEEKEENKQLERIKINQNYQNIQNNDRNIDYFLILNKQKSNNNNKEKCSNKPYFNRKCFSTSKINNNISVEKKFINDYNTNRNLKINENFNRNKIINFTNNIMNKNNMTYSKPRLLTEYSKRNSNNNISYKNNTFNKNGGCNKHSIKNIKYLTLNEKVNNSYKNKRNKKSSILDSLYYNYKDNTENNNFFKNNYLKENIKNQTAFSFDQPEMNNSEKVKDLKGFFNEKKGRKNLKLKQSKQFQSTAKKNKKIISDKNMEDEQNIDFNPNNNNFYNNSTIKYNMNEIYNKSKKDFPFLNSKDEDLSKSSITEKKNRQEKYNYIFPYEHLIFNDNNNIEKNCKNCDIYKTQKMIKDYNHNNYSSKSLNSNNMNNNNDKEKIDFLLNMLNVNDINEGIIKVNNLLKYEKDINQLKELYKNAYHEKYNFDKNEIWLSKIINNYKRNERYKNFCQNIMIIYKIKNFEEFKKFTKKLLTKTKNKDYKEYSNGKNKINIDKNYSNSKYNKADILKKNKNIKENEKDIDSNNSEDINFTNIQNFKIITDYIN